MRPLVFGFVVVPHFSLIALSACVDPLRLANQVLDRAAYQSVLLSVEGGLVHSSDGIAVMSQHSLAQAIVGAGAGAAQVHGGNAFVLHLCGLG